MEARSPAQLLDFTGDVGKGKAERGFLSTLILAFFAGAFIAFGAEGSNMAAFNLLGNAATYGVGRVVSGAVFGVGLMMVLIAGAELFTGNNLILVSVLDKKTTVGKMLMNWVVVYIGNFIGSIFIAYIITHSTLPNASGGALGALTINIAYGKTTMSFGNAFGMGILCNWLVCLAVWVSFAEKGVIGKMFASFFIIGLFVISGFEHSVANMYYIPAGIMASGNDAWRQAWLNGATTRTAQALAANLNWGTMIAKNLIPVTLGNIVGGAGFVGLFYWLAFRTGAKKA